jgi:serine/threonine-protein kinase
MSWSGAGLLIGPWDASALLQVRGFAGVSLFTPGGRLQPLSILQKGELGHTLPRWLPGNAAFLYTARKRVWTWSDDQVFAWVVATGERKPLLSNAVDARYVPGYLVFLRERKLYAVPFDASRLEVRGEAVPIVDNLAQALANTGADDVSGAGQFSVTDAGSLAYLEDRQPLWPDNIQLVSVDRAGNVTPLPTPPESYAANVRVEPRTGGRVANVVNELADRQIHVFDLLDGGRFVTELGDGREVGMNRVWTRDGKRITFEWLNSSAVWEIAWQAADGSAKPEKLAEAGTPAAWTPGGELVGLKDGDIWVLWDPAGKAGRRAIVQTPGEKESWPAVSRDGRWLAYGSNDRKGYNVYVQPYPGLGRRQTVSVGGGECPVWNPAADELFFLTPPDAAGERWMMAVAMPSGADDRPGTPRRLFKFSEADLRFYSDPLAGYDVAPDGRSFFTTRALPIPPPQPVTSIHVILNWFEELKAKLSDK